MPTCERVWHELKNNVCRRWFEGKGLKKWFSECREHKLSADWNKRAKGELEHPRYEFWMYEGVQGWRLIVSFWERNDLYTSGRASERRKVRYTSLWERNDPLGESIIGSVKWLLGERWRAKDRRCVKVERCEVRRFMTDIVSVTSEFRLLLAAGWSGTSQSLRHQKQCQINTITTSTHLVIFEVKSYRTSRRIDLWSK